jgi:hypothetical protein
MGQRLQAFIHCVNPTIGLKEQLKSLKKYGGTKKEIEQLQTKVKQFETAFGSKPNTMIAYHHQWLYGRSSLLAAINLIEFNQHCEMESNPFKTQSDIYGDEYLSLLTNLLGLFKNKLAKTIGRFGYEHFRLLNFLDPQMRSDCTLGDNNDGIFVIDSINDAYCFANIGTGDSTIIQLPVLTPCSADQYVQLYYPIEVDDCQIDNVPETTAEQETAFNNNRRMNRLFTKPFENYRLMTQTELKKMFPAAFTTLTTPNDII